MLSRNADDRRRRRGSPRRPLTTVLAALLSLVAVAPPAAMADTTYEATASWASGTAGEVRQREVLTSEWRFSLNDPAEAPANELVENVFATITAVNGTFTSVPDACLVSGVDPVSAISADGTTVTCNLGAQTQGTAVAVQIPVVATGDVGDEVRLVGDFSGSAAETTPIPVVAGLDIDFKLSESDAWHQPTGVSDYEWIEFPWSLYLGDGSVAGPSSLSYTFTAAVTGGALRTTTGTTGCDRFTRSDFGASGHPWSGGTHPADQMASFVTSCTLSQVSGNTYTLTLNGIDWSVLNAPGRDSAGNLLPADRKVVASGRVYFQINPTDGIDTVTMKLTATAPAYAVGGLSATDDPSNNSVQKVITYWSGWSGIWGRGGTGTTSWDDALRKSAGATVSTYMDSGLPRSNTAISQCTILDSKYVTFANRVTVAPTVGEAADMGPYTVYYYTGSNAYLDPGSPFYDPNSIGNCGVLDAGGWTTTAPADLSTVKAVRVDFNAQDMQQAERIKLVVEATIKPDVPAGQDIWVWHSLKRGSTWTSLYSPAGTAATRRVTDTPNARYPYTTKSRDILRVVAVTPAVGKSVSRSPIRLGDEVTFTLTYSANGGSYIEPVVDGYQIVDTLPGGLSYVEGSATPAPAVTTNADGQQVLTWSLDGVATNTANTLTYRVTTDDSTVAGVVMKNSVVTKVGGLTSSPAQASVTVSTSGVTVIGKSADQDLIPNLDGDGDGTGSWTISLRANDPSGQEFTDVIDILPYNGDERGTSFSGDYAVTDVIADGGTVYYTTTDPAALSDDPADPRNGTAGDPTGNSAGWTTTKPDASQITAIRVIAGPLAASATRSFQVVITSDGARGGDVYVNRAQARASHTELVTRTSAPTAISQYYAYDLKKYVQGSDGEWHDAQDTNEADWPVFSDGDVAAVNYRIVVTNTGQGALNDITVTDARFPAGNHTIAALASGESHEFLFTADLSAVTSPIRNVASAHAALPPDSSQSELPDPSDEANVVVTETFPIRVEKLGRNCDVGRPTCALAGAQFALYDTDPSQAGAEPIENGISADAADGSLFTSVGLSPGTYWLVETRAPSGFSLLATPVPFTLTASGIVLADPADPLVSVVDGSAFTVRVLDATAAPLPTAGGDGPWPALAGGLLLFGLAALIHHLTSGSRRSRTRTS
ncbi:SpaA isopeptide-forming pilin-related protein [Propionicicella superfundia]|uniref:SpaA isopeptide-forming pilin-related protein n=1 Tax=Propionicicella superfundia TaxID=348582 RepID=UPI00041F9DCE|nr:SpaA isopeptide-forming pilin-related protein [Propionicicella superfundia]